MTLLRRTLYAMAGVWAVSGLALIAVPRWVLVDVFDQIPYPDYGMVRITGVVSFCVALLVTITAQKLEDMWVFTWAYVFAEIGIALVGIPNAIWGRSDGSGALLWWLLGLSGVGFTIALVVGLAKTGTERPAV